MCCLYWPQFSLLRVRLWNWAGSCEARLCQTVLHCRTSVICSVQHWRWCLHWLWVYVHVCLPLLYLSLHMHVVVLWSMSCSTTQIVYTQCHWHRVLNFRAHGLCSLPLSSGPDGTELILTEGGVHSLSFAIVCDSGSNKMAGPFLVNTQGPEDCEPAHVSRIQRESRVLLRLLCALQSGARLLGWHIHTTNNGQNGDFGVQWRNTQLHVHWWHSLGMQSICMTQQFLMVHNACLYSDKYGTQLGPSFRESSNLQYKTAHYP